MCAQLEHVTDEEWDDLRVLVKDLSEKVDSLVGWRNMVFGGFSVITVVMGMALYIFSEALEQQETNQETIIALQKDFAVFQQEVKPFLIAGPRFTINDYEVMSRSNELEMKEWVRENFEPKVKE